MNPLERHYFYCIRGFTLIELMVTMGIVAILASVAIPAYSGFILQTRKVECQVSIVNYLRAQELYYLENGTFYADKFKNGKGTSKIAWKKKKRPDKPEKYRFPNLDVEFRRDNFRGYKIRVWEVQNPGNYRQEVWLELKTDEDYDNDGVTDYYSYRKYRRPKTKGKWRVQNQFWFDIHGCQAWSTCK